jgi:AsmA protein
MKTAKILGVIVAGVVVLIAVGLLAVSLLVNPNNFKPRIIAAVKDSTHRELDLKGDIKLSVFPWIALELGPATLGSPEGFKNAPFMTFNRAKVRVKLLPLLRKELEIDRVELDGLDLNLVKNAAGKGNWDMGSDDSAAPQVDKASSGSAASLKSFGGLKITQGRVKYAPYLIEHFDLETGAVVPGKEVPITMSLDANRGVVGEQFTVSAKLDAQYDADIQDAQIAALNLSGTLTRPGQGSPVHYEFSIPKLDANLKQQTLSIPDFSAMLSSARLSGKLAATKFIDAPSATGSIQLSPLVLHEFAPRFGIDLPKTRDAKALSSFSLGSNFSYDAEKTELTNIEIKLDDTTLKGNITLLSGKSSAVKFKLSADRIDLDRYRPPPGAVPDPKSAAADKPAPKKADAEEPLNAAGVFTLGSVKAAGVELTNLSVTVDMKDNVTHLHPLEAQMYGGRYAGDLTYDARTATAALSMDEHLTGVDVAQLVANSHLKGRITGKASVNIKGTARGNEADAIEKTLNGHVDTSIADGALEGVDVGYELALAQSLLNKQTSTSVQNTHKTAFDAFKVSAQITNGIAETHDLTISSAVLKVGGQGTINLPTTGIDMTLLTSLMKSATTTAVDIPLKITGTYTDPKVRPDLEAAAKGAVKQKLNDVLKKNGLDLNSLFKK